jgi:hypothetical protein
LGWPQQCPDAPGYQECGKNKGKNKKTRTKDEQKDEQKDDRSNKQRGKKIHKTRKMNQHDNFGLDLRKSCNPGVQGCPGAFQGVGFRTTLRPRLEPQVMYTFMAVPSKKKKSNILKNKKNLMQHLHKVVHLNRGLPEFFTFHLTLYFLLLRLKCA